MSPWWVRLAEELWPRATWNDQIRKVWTDRFRNDANETLAQAIRNVRCSKSSERLEIAWVIAELAAIKANQRKHLRNDEPAEDPVDRARREAEEADAEIVQAAASLKLLPPEDLRSLICEVQRCLPGLRMRGEVSEWSRLAIGLAHACGMERRLWSMPSLGPSPVLEHSCVTGECASTDRLRPSSSSSPAANPHGERSDEATQPSPDLAVLW